MGFTGSKATPLVKSAADAAIQAAFKKITLTERDGFGFAQSGSAGLRSRFLVPSEFHSIDGTATLHKRAGKAAGAFSTTYRTAHEGVYKPNHHLIAHGRTATCGVSLENVHPFRRKGWTLAHNGVVSYKTDKADKSHDKVTCDSQHLLICMADHNTTEARKEALKHITGYAAFLALSPQGKLVVAVDDTARLYAGITNRGRWIFGTTEAIVEAVADAWKSKGVKAYPIDAWTWLEFDMEGNDPELSEWKHGKASSTQMGFAGKSLGWSAAEYKRRKSVNRSVDSHGTYTYGGYDSYYNPQPSLLTQEEAQKQAELAEQGIPDWDK
jgi:hypothetical protein